MWVHEKKIWLHTAVQYHNKTEWPENTTKRKVKKVKSRHATQIHISNMNNSTGVWLNPQNGLKLRHGLNQATHWPNDSAEARGTLILCI